MMFFKNWFQGLLTGVLIIALATLTILAQPADVPVHNVKVESPAQVTSPQPEQSSWFFRETDNLVTLIGYVIVGIAAFLAYKQWRADQRWKRLEALMERIKALTDTPGSHNAIMMLASNDREIPLWDKEKPEDRYVRVNWTEAAWALIPTNIMTYPYDSKRMAILDSFNDLLGRLSHLEAFLEAKLLSKDEAKHIMNDFILRLHIAENTTLSRNLRIYINRLRMDDVQNLFKRFGIDLKDNIDAEENELRKEITQGVWNMPDRS